LKAAAHCAAGGLGIEELVLESQLADSAALKRSAQAVASASENATRPLAAASRACAHSMLGLKSCNHVCWEPPTHLPPTAAAREIKSRQNDSASTTATSPPADPALPTSPPAALLPAVPLEIPPSALDCPPAPACVPVLSVVDPQASASKIIPANPTNEEIFMSHHGSR
jgi:hypothetical protein